MEKDKRRTFTIKDMSEHLKVSTITIHRMIRKRTFAPCYKVGGQIRCVVEDFYNWEDEQKEHFRKNYQV